MKLRNLTALPGSLTRAARNAAMLSVVPAQTTHSLEKPGMIKKNL